MQSQCFRWYRRFMMVTLVCLFVPFLPIAALAQDPTPPSSPEDGATSTLPHAEVFSETIVEDEGDITEEQEGVNDDYVAPALSVGTVSNDGASVDQSLSPLATQGVIRLDVIAPETIRSGDTINYTYAYNNTGSATSFIVQAIWTNYNNDGNWQDCLDAGSGANCDPINRIGPTVTRLASCPSNISTGRNDQICYEVSSLGAGQAGQFTISMGTKSDQFPKTGEQPKRPASSGRLFIGSSSTPTSEDTANTLIVGPVLVLTKEVVSSSQNIYPLETAEFKITIGNATDPEDQAGGQIRADARTATNVILTDFVPRGAEFVSGTNNPQVKTIDGQPALQWTFASLAPGQQQEVRITFRKLDVDDQCGRLDNRTYRATSNEYPIRNGSERYEVSGRGERINVTTPLKVASVRAEPRSVIYGNTAEITISVENYWSQPLSGVQLHYDIQSNGFYTSNPAPSPNPSTTPNPSTPGGRITWTFNIGAGNHTTPTTQEFKLTVRGDYRQSGTGTAQLVVPSSVPSACIESVRGEVRLDPRLTVSKTTNVEEQFGRDYIVERDAQVEYSISITNNGVADANGVKIVDTLPDERGANFTYINGSATIPPSTFTNGNGGQIVWNSINIGVNRTVTIRYRVQVSGEDYRSYCNEVEAMIGEEEIDYDPNRVCIKINPDIVITKTVNGQQEINADPGQEVRFQVSLTNNEPTPYQAGLYDELPRGLTYVRTESGYDLSPEQDRNNLKWDLVTVNPGQRIEVTFVAQVPDDCSGRYVNDGLFHNADENIITPIPPVSAIVQCGLLEYRKNTVGGDDVSLRARVTYEIQLNNKDDNDARNVKVIDILPQGFTYESMSDGDFATEPEQTTREDGRIELTWTVPSVAASERVNVRYIARSGDVVGQHDNLVTVPDIGKCVGGCVTGEDGTTYSLKSVTVAPLITIEPTINDTSCATIGDKRIYRLAILNTDDNAYTNTRVAVNAPIGLNLSRPIGDTPTPSVIVDGDGVRQFVWSGMTIAEKPRDAFATQVILEIELEVGQVWGDLDTIVQTSSPDGAIPRKEGVEEPIVRVCPDTPAIAKEVSGRFVRSGEEVFYLISVANPTSSPISATFEDPLPTGLTYVENIEGPAPEQDGNTLRWNITVPAANEGIAGTVHIKFKVRVSGSIGSSHTNTVNMISPANFNTTYTSVEVIIARTVFLPIVRR